VVLVEVGVPDTKPLVVLYVNPEGKVGANAKLTVPYPPLDLIGVNYIGVAL
jgi:hypothetical protein